MQVPSSKNRLFFIICVLHVFSLTVCMQYMLSALLSVCKSVVECIVTRPWKYNGVPLSCVLCVCGVCVHKDGCVCVRVRVCVCACECVCV